MIRLLCYESHPGWFSVFPSVISIHNKFDCGLFMCVVIFSKCQGLILSSVCSEMLLMIAVPGAVTQWGLKDRSSMARISEASLSAEISPRITTWSSIHTKKSFKTSNYASPCNLVYLACVCTCSICVCMVYLLCIYYVFNVYAWMDGAQLNTRLRGYSPASLENADLN